MPKKRTATPPRHAKAEAQPLAPPEPAKKSRRPEDFSDDELLRRADMREADGSIDFDLDPLRVSGRDERE